MDITVDQIFSKFRKIEKAILKLLSVFLSLIRVQIYIKMQKDKRKKHLFNTPRLI